MSSPPSAHVRFFVDAFAEPVVTAAYARDQLPAAIVRRVQWPTLRREDARVAGAPPTAAHLLFSARQRSGLPVAVYLMFEHRAQRDLGLPIRVFNASLAIQDAWMHACPPHAPVPPVLPLLLYSGREPFRSPRDLRELFRAPVHHGVAASIPRFKIWVHDLTEESTQDLLASIVPTQSGGWSRGP